MFVKAYTSTLSGIDALTVTVEVDISTGIGMFLVGLPDNAVKESQERIRTAFLNSGFRMTGKKVVVNLAPADLRKEGSAYDLPMAIAILAASGQADDKLLGDYVIAGELSLDGSLAHVKGVLPMAVRARNEGFKGIVIPRVNAREAAVVAGLDVIAVDNLKQAAGFLSGDIAIEPYVLEEAQEVALSNNPYEEDFSDVKGQAHVKRALEIAAAGGHNIIMIGPPGSGKTMLARRLPTIMPPLSHEEALETTKIHSVAGKTGAEGGLLVRRPFRAPHHLTSQVALVGGGVSPQPGEISLAHNGILFLDELPEFGRALLEVLRQPLEDKTITVSRAKYTVEYPANFMLAASMNPCPCGYFNHPAKECVCSRGAVMKYMNRISGPLFDRIDLHIEVTPVEIGQMGSSAVPESSERVRRRVVEAREIQRRRFAECPGIHVNAMMNSKMLRSYAPLSAECASLLERAMERLNLSARAYDRVIKVARTIADLEAAADVQPNHIAEAITYRDLDRGQWGIK